MNENLSLKITKIVDKIVKIPYLENLDKKELRSFINDWDIRIYESKSELLSISFSHNRLNCEFNFETDYVKYDDFRIVKMKDLFMQECIGID